MNLTDREKEQLKAMIDAGKPCHAALKRETLYSTFSIACDCR